MNIETKQTVGMTAREKKERKQTEELLFDLETKKLGLTRMGVYTLGGWGEGSDLKRLYDGLPNRYKMSLFVVTGHLLKNNPEDRLELARIENIMSYYTGYEIDRMMKSKRWKSGAA